MKTKYLLGLNIVIILLIGCNGDSTSQKEPSSVEKSMNVNFEYQHIYTQTGEQKVIEIHVNPKKTIIEEIDKLSKKIDINSCQIIDKSIIKIGDNSISNIGNIVVTAEWSETPLTILRYSNMTKNYNAVAIYGTDKRITNYRSGDKVTFKGDSSKFATTGKALTPIKILSPKTNIDKTVPLKIIWSGGSSQDIIIYLTAIWTSWIDEGTQTLACHIENDGEFIIPINILDKFEWRQKTKLSIIDRQTIMTENAKLIIGTTDTLTIYTDKNATPPSPTETMQDGYIGNACSTKEECGGGDCIQDNIFADGYCGLKYCKSDNECPNDANCFIQRRQSSIPQFCAKPCSVDSDCRTPYYECREGDNQIKSCVPAVY